MKHVDWLVVKAVLFIFLMLWLLQSMSHAAHAEQYVQFPVKEFSKAMTRVEQDRTALSLYKKQNADLKQLHVLSTEQLAQCEAIVKAQGEMTKLDAEYQRQMEAKAEGLKASLKTSHYIIGTETLVAGAIIAWLLW